MFSMRVQRHEGSKGHDLHTLNELTHSADVQSFGTLSVDLERGQKSPRRARVRAEKYISSVQIHLPIGVCR